MTEFVSHDLHDNDWIGVVINVKDPQYMGRCRIRVFGLMDNLEDNHIPWATPVNSTIFGGDGAGSLSIPKIGQFVRVQFNNGELYSPEYTTIQNIDSQLIDSIKDDYEGTHVILYDPDQELSIVFQKNMGFKIFYKEAYILIDNESAITIQTPNNESVIEMVGDKCNIVTQNEINITGSSKVNITGSEVIAAGSQVTKIGPGPGYNHAVLAEILFPLLTSLATAIDTKLPVTPGVSVGLVEASKSAATSTNVLLST